MVTVTAKQQITSEETIEYETVTKESSEVLKNTTIVEQKGSNGKKQITKLVTTENGKTVKTEVQESKVIKSPTKKLSLIHICSDDRETRRWDRACAKQDEGL